MPSRLAHARSHQQQPEAEQNSAVEAGSRPIARRRRQRRAPTCTVTGRSMQMAHKSSAAPVPSAHRPSSAEGTLRQRPAAAAAALQAAEPAAPGRVPEGVAGAEGQAPRMRSTSEPTSASRRRCDSGSAGAPGEQAAGSARRGVVRRTGRGPWAGCKRSWPGQQRTGRTGACTTHVSLPAASPAPTLLLHQLPQLLHGAPQVLRALGLGACARQVDARAGRRVAQRLAGRNELCGLSDSLGGAEAVARLCKGSSSGGRRRNRAR